MTIPANPHPLDAAARDELARKAEEVIELRLLYKGAPNNGFSQFDVRAALDHAEEALDAAGSPEVILALLASVRGAEADTARLSWLEAMLRPLPWGGVYALVESDGESLFRFTMQPSSGDAPFLNETGTTLRDAIDAAMNHKDEEPKDAR